MILVWSSSGSAPQPQGHCPQPAGHPPQAGTSGVLIGVSIRTPAVLHPGTCTGLTAHGPVKPACVPKGTVWLFKQADTSVPIVHDIRCALHCPLTGQGAAQCITGTHCMLESLLCGDDPSFHHRPFQLVKQSATSVRTSRPRDHDMTSAAEGLDLYTTTRSANGT